MSDDKGPLIPVPNIVKGSYKQRFVSFTIDYGTSPDQAVEVTTVEGKAVSVEGKNTEGVFILVAIGEGERQRTHLFTVPEAQNLVEVYERSGVKVGHIPGQFQDLLLALKQAIAAEHGPPIAGDKPLHIFEPNGSVN
jgi:hypothetical protein